MPPDADLRSASLPSRRARLLLLGVVGSAAVVVSIVAAVVAVQMGQQLTILAGVVALLLIALSLRWPLAPLFVYAALIPFDEAIRFGDAGTVGRSAAILFAVCYAIPRLGRLTLGAAPGAAWGYLGWALLSVGWAIDQSVAIRELGTLVQLFAIGFLIADVVVHRPSVVRPLLWVYTLAAAVTASIGILGYLGGETAEGVRVAALPNQDPAQYAAVLLPAFVFAAWQLIEGRFVTLSAVATGVTAIGILLSGTRGAWLAAAIVAVVYLLPLIRRRRRFAAIGAVAVIVVIVALLPGVVDFVSRRAETAISTGGAGRTDIWTVGLLIVESAPVTGVGYGNFPVAYTPEILRAAQLQVDTGTGRAPHNIVLGTMAELGPVGVLLLAMFLGGLILRSGWGPDATVVQACLVSLIASAFFLDILDNRKQVWLILGLAAGLRYLAAHAGETPAESVRSWPPLIELRRRAHQGWRRPGPSGPALPPPPTNISSRRT